MPSKTRCLVLFIETKNFDEVRVQSMDVAAALGDGAGASHGERLQFHSAAHELLPRSVNRHGRCAERLMPMRLSATTSKVARELETKQWRGSEQRSIS